MLHWLEDISNDLLVRFRLAWASCHICFAFLQIRGPFFTEDTAEVLQMLFTVYDNGILASIDDQFVLFLFAYIVSQYGHLPPNANDTFLSTVEHALTQIEEGEDMSFSMMFEPQTNMVLFPNPPGLPERNPLPNGNLNH